ncbi:MAG: hypothetical protein ACW9W4_06375 [Candidatus Nitrosopumilus sp. bin_7KS]
MIDHTKNYKVFDNGMIHIANDGFRLCTEEPESREKFDGKYDFNQLCLKCQGKLQR